MLKNFISKEVFKMYLNDCQKFALASANLELLKETIRLFQAKEVAFVGTNPLETEMNLSEEDEDEKGTAPINPVKSFINYLKQFDDEESQKKLELLQAMDDDDDDFETDVPTANSIKDGLLFGQAVREYFTEQNEQFNLADGTNRKCRDFNGLAFRASQEETDIAVLEKDHRYLFEAAFMCDGKLKIRPDVLQLNGDLHVTIYEAKASTYGEKKTIKKEHYLDLFYQIYVLTRLGYIVDDAYLVYIDRNYIRTEDKTIDFWNKADFYKEMVKEKSFNYDFKTDVEPVLQRIAERGPEVTMEPCDVDYGKLIYKFNIVHNEKTINEYAHDWINDGTIEKTLKKIDSEITRYVTAVRNQEDDFKKFLTSHICCKIAPPSKRKKESTEIVIKSNSCKYVFPWFDEKRPNVLYFLPPSKAKEFMLKYQVFYLDEFDFENLEKYTNKKGLFYFGNLQVFRDKCRLFSAIVNHEQIEDKDLMFAGMDVFEHILQDYTYPIYMYDFETSSWSIPPFEYGVSYDQIPFQYSIHVLDKEDDLFNGEYYREGQHFQFLAQEAKDPRQQFIFNFVRDAFAHGPGVYVSYNKAFEIGVLRKIAAIYPLYEKPLMYICEHTIDMIDFFKLKGIIPIYHPQFKRSYSIKYTQPALYPDLQYTDLLINKGDKASYMFRDFVENQKVKVWNEVHYPNMIAYCNRDTEAMVVLFKRIIEIYHANKEVQNEV
jgi:hypothetical protein